MTKTNLEIEFDEWYKNQKEMNPYIMRDWFISKLQQRMDEIVSRIETMVVEPTLKDNKEEAEKADLINEYLLPVVKEKVLNIIKSVDKNNVDTN